MFNGNRLAPSVRAKAREIERDECRFGLILVGFVNVARRFVRLLGERAERLQRYYDLARRVIPHRHASARRRAPPPTASTSRGRASWWRVEGPSVLWREAVSPPRRSSSGRRSRRPSEPTQLARSSWLTQKYSTSRRDNPRSTTCGRRSSAAPTSSRRTRSGSRLPRESCSQPRLRHPPSSRLPLRRRGDGRSRSSTWSETLPAVHHGFAASSTARPITS